jgi:hypothetical protein
MVVGSAPLLRHLSGFESRHLSKIQNGRHKQRSGQRNLLRKKYTKTYHGGRAELFSYMHIICLKKFNFLPKFCVKHFIVQALFQSAQHLCEKRVGSGSGFVPLTNRSGRPENMRALRIQIPNTGTIYNKYGTGTIIRTNFLIFIIFAPSFSARSRQ